MRPLCGLQAALAFLAAFTAAGAQLDTNRLEQIIGLKGKWNAEESVFKITQPRTDVNVSVDQWQMPPFMGLTSWAAFKAGAKENAMVMGDLVLFQDEVNPVMSVLFENGVDVTALHNHFFYDTPKVYFMHIGGEGSAEKLAQGVRAALAKTKEIRSRKSQPAENFGRAIPAANSISPEPLQQILAVNPEVKDGMARFVFGRVTKMPCGCEAGKEMGVNTWAAFAGSDDNAVVDGDFACQEDELQPVLRSLRKSGIDIVAIHQHMTHEQPRYLFLHYWGRGKAADLADALRLARGEQSKATAAGARATGGFQDVNTAHFDKHRRDGAIVLDVRTPDEFATGHVPGALNIDINAPGFASRVAELDKAKTILVHCQAGSRGAVAAAELAKLGFHTVCNLEGGLTAWEKAGNEPAARLTTLPATIVSFDDAAPGELPAGWDATKTGEGRPKWTIEKDESAPSRPNVLRQSGEADYPLAVKSDTSIQDGFVEVKFKPVAGEEDQAAGVVWRYQDANNYYIARANALENNVRIYHFVNGRRTQFEGTKIEVPTGQWQSLRVDFSADTARVMLNGKQLFNATNATIKAAGKVGVWTKADSVTHFDDFTCGGK